jgi:hypothetical protein
LFEARISVIRMASEISQMVIAFLAAFPAFALSHHALGRTPCMKKVTTPAEVYADEVCGEEEVGGDEQLCMEDSFGGFLLDDGRGVIGLQQGEKLR